MEKTKAFLEAHYKRYIFTICFLWFLMFFLPWDLQIGGVSVYFFIMKNHEKTLCRLWCIGNLFLSTD